MSTIQGHLNLQEIDALIAKGTSIISKQEERRLLREANLQRINTMRDELQDSAELLDAHIRAATIIGVSSDAMVTNTLNVITSVINKALAVIFPEDPRSISLTHEMHKKIHPHFVVNLYVGHERKRRSFKMSGTGLKQIISILFNASLLDVRGGRLLLILDEVLNGLHPTAQDLMRELIKALARRFQFIIVEHGFDIGKQYLVQRNGARSVVSHYKRGTHYRDAMQDILKKRGGDELEVVPGSDPYEEPESSEM